MSMLTVGNEWSVVFADLIERGTAFCDRMNAIRVREFWQRYERAERIWKMNRQRIPYDPPAPMMYIRADFQSLILYGYDYLDSHVIEPLPDAPWVVNPDPDPEPQPAGFFEFIPSDYDPDVWMAGNTNLPANSVRLNTTDGRNYRLWINTAGGFTRKLWLFQQEV